MCISSTIRSPRDINHIGYMALRAVHTLAACELEIARASVIHERRRIDKRNYKVRRDFCATDNYCADILVSLC